MGQCQTPTSCQDQGPVPLSFECCQPSSASCTSLNVAARLSFSLKGRMLPYSFRPLSLSLPPTSFFPLALTALWHSAYLPVCCPSCPRPPGPELHEKGTLYRLLYPQLQEELPGIRQVLERSSSNEWMWERMKWTNHKCLTFCCIWPSLPLKWVSRWCFSPY